MLSPHGLQGEVNIRPLTDYPERWAELTEVSVLEGDQRRYLNVQSVRYCPESLIVRFAGYETREAAAALQGRYLQISRAAARPLPPDTYWMADLVGMQVITLQGDFVGTIREIYQAGNDLLEVATPDGRQILIPMVRAFVKAVELAERKLLLEPIPGLLD